MKKSGAIGGDDPGAPGQHDQVGRKMSILGEWGRGGARGHGDMIAEERVCCKGRRGEEGMKNGRGEEGKSGRLPPTGNGALGEAAVARGRW